MAGVSGMASISAGQQFRAIAFLRWRLFANGFRRKGGAGELVARLIVYPIGFLFLLGPTLGAGFGSWAAVSAGKLQVVSMVFWGITLLQVLVSINISPPGMSFDPETLIRFPVSLSRYVVVRLFLGLLSAATIVGTCCLLAAAVGTTVARPDLAAIVFPAAILLAITNMLMVRMAFAWIDRWLSTRRARELFTGFIIVISVGVQYVNLTFNPGFNRHGGEAQLRKIAAARHLYHSSQAILSHFPSGLAGASVVNVAHAATPYAVGNLFALTLYAGLFLMVFAWRMEREYRGESLSDTAGAAAPARDTTGPANAMMPGAVLPPVLSQTADAPGFKLPGPLSAALTKEWIYVRRNMMQLYGMLGPVAMVFLFAGRVGSHFSGSTWTFPAAMAYSTLGISALAYNSFGLDAEGIQFYFLAPVRLSTIVLAKNLFSFAIVGAEFLLVYVVLAIVASRPTLPVALATLAWLILAALVNVTVGNMRSVIAPKKMDPSKLSRKQTSQLSALMSILLMLVAGAVGAGVMFLGISLELPWLPVVVLAALAVGAAALYRAGLTGLDALASKHQETMIEELCKAS